MLYWLLLCSELEESCEIVLTKDEQERRPLLSSKSSESSRHALKASRASSAELLKQNFCQMRRQPRDAVRQHLLKVCLPPIVATVFDLPLTTGTWKYQ